MPDQEDHPLDDDLTAKEKAERERAEKLHQKLVLRDECRYLLASMPAFMAMLERGRGDAERAVNQAVDDMRPIEVVQRHVGAKRAVTDLISDIKKMAVFKVPAKKPERRPMYD